MSVTDELLANNEAYAAAFDKGDLPLPPGKKVAIVACMDARLNVYGALGLHEGDAHVIRNAGGVITRRRDPLAGDLPAAARHRGDHPHPPHRLRDAHVHRRRRSGVRSRTRPASSRNGPLSRSPTSTRTSASRSPASRPARSCPGPTRCAGSSTTSPPASCARSAETHLTLTATNESRSAPTTTRPENSARASSIHRSCAAASGAGTMCVITSVPTPARAAVVAAWVVVEW